ncbi:MAG TPA: type II toxin-antitoxin system VapC family toxin [Patescibacteria group bacterium]|nr:type II toxin-antitoxin system VapC family toxin [Patescibacteria group bacterium]
MQLLLDTNILIEHLQFGTIPPPHFFDYSISTITEAEILRLSGVGEQEIEKIEQWLMTVEIIPVTSVIARKAAFLGRTRKTKLPDLLIAATAIELNIPLVTKNVKDFRRIPHLKVMKQIS